MHVVWEWDCDPGEVDNDLGPKTRGAVRKFQAAYNGGEAPLPDGLAEPIAWGMNCGTGPSGLLGAVGCAAKRSNRVNWHGFIGPPYFRGCYVPLRCTSQPTAPMPESLSDYSVRGKRLAVSLSNRDWATGKTGTGSVA